MFKLGMMFSTNADKISPKVSKLSKDFNSLGRNVKQGDKDFSKYFSTLRKHDNSFSNIAKDANRAGNSINKLTKNMTGLSSVFNVGTISAYALGRVIGDSIQASIDMIETTHLFSVAMGDLAVETDKAVESMSNLFGLDKTNIQSTVGTYNLLARSMGMTAENSQILSTNTQKLALDLSSLTNVPITQVMQDLRSGLVGQSETVYKYGVDVTEASLKQEAMRQGIVKSVRNMSQGEKMALRYAVMIRQTALAQGDFASTIETPANQLKIFTERTATLARAFGSLFVPALGTVLPYLNAFLQVLTGIINALARILGYVPPVVENISSSFGSLGDGADDAVEAIGGVGKAIKKLQDTNLGFDELNTIQKPTDSSVGGVSGGIDTSTLDMVLPSYDNLMNGVKQKSDEIAESMRKMLETFKQLSEPVINADFQPLIDSLGRLWESLTPFGNLIGQGLLTFYTKILMPLGKWTIEIGLPAFFNLLADNLNYLFKVVGELSPRLQELAYDGLYKISDWFIQYKDLIILGIAGIVGAIGGLYALGLIGKIAEFVIQFQFMFGLLKLFLMENPIILVAVAFGALASMIVVAYKQNDVFRDKVNKMVDYLQNVFAPIISNMAILVGTAFATIKNVWDNVLYPVWVNFMETVDWLWTNHLYPLIAKIGILITELVKGALRIINEFIIPLIDAFVNIFGSGIASTFNFVLNVIGTVIAMAIDIIKGLVTVLIGIVQFITAVFTGDWKLAWQGIVNVFKGIFGAIGGIAKGIINSVIDLINGMINGIVSGINAVIGFIMGLVRDANKALSALKMPTISVNIAKIRPVSIPKLARGGTLEDGQMFEAGEFGKAELLGGYNNKTTVMPLENSGFVDAMYNAVYNAVSSAQGESGGQIIENVLNLDGEVIYRNQQKVVSRRGVNFGMGVFAR